MVDVTIYNDSKSGLESDIDIIVIVAGKEVARHTAKGGEECPECMAFEIASRVECLVIVPKGVAWPLEVTEERVRGYKRAPITKLQEHRGKK